MILSPNSPSDVADIVSSNTNLLPIGGRTKPALLPVDANLVEMGGLSGIIEYDPNEYTLTALAGTPVKTVADTVAQNGQYLPFDPILVEEGATLGGTVAANSGGSGRFRYGGIRDFIIGIRFVDGYGRIVRGGGKVVKNASGFDLPKFMTGSIGRYGILTEVTLKIFPRPREYRSLAVRYDSLSLAMEAIFALANQPYEMDALDIEMSREAATLLIRLGGLPESLPQRVDRLSTWLSEHTASLEINALTGTKESETWKEHNRLAWADQNDCLAKVIVPPKRVVDLDRIQSVSGRHYAAGGSLAWLTCHPDQLKQLDQDLNRLKVAGMLIRGRSDSPYIGHHTWQPLARRVKQALDPHNRFLDIGL